MKTFLIALLTSVSVTCFAQDAFESFKLTNKTYPDQVITFECLDIQCEALEVSYVKSSLIENSRIIYKTEIEDAADVRRKIIIDDEVVSYYETRNVIGRVGKQWREGEEFKAIGNALVSPLVAIFDTVFNLPLQLVVAPMTAEVKVVKGHVGGKRALKISNNMKDVSLKHKKFLKVKDALRI